MNKQKTMEQLNSKHQNKKFLYTVKIIFVLGRNPNIKEAKEDFYCTEKERDFNCDLIERSIIRCGGQVLEFKTLTKK